MQPLIGLAAQIVIRVQENLKEARQVFFAERFRRPLDWWALIGGCGDQIGVGSANARDQQVPEMADSLAAEMLQVLPLREKSMYQGKHAFGGALFDRAGQLVQNFSRHHAQQFAHLRVGDR